MSYEFWIEPAGQASPEQAALTLPALLAHLRSLPGWADAPVVSEQPHCLVLDAPLLGEVQCTAERVLIGLGNKDFREFLLALRPLLLALAPLGFRGMDPQLGRRPVEAGADSAEFLRQYRRLVRGSKTEFEYWCSTGIPPAWIERDAARQRFEQACRSAFARIPDLPYFQELMAMEFAQVEALLDQLIASNDQRLADSGIADELAKRAARSPSPIIRASGERLPPMDSWYYGSSLQQEILLLDVLLRRQHPRGESWAALHQALAEARATRAST